MPRVHILMATLFLLAACSEDAGPGTGPEGLTLTVDAGAGQQGTAGQPLAPFAVVVERDGAPEPGVTVAWTVVEGAAALAPAASLTGPDGTAEVTVTPDAGAYGTLRVQAEVSGGPAPVSISAQVFLPFTVAGGGNNVPERYGSDLWVHGAHAYTGTWGFRVHPGNTVKVWALGSSGAPSAAGEVLVAGIGTVSDIEVSPDGAFLVFSAEGGGSAAGLYSYSLANPAVPVFIDHASVGAGYHTASLATIGGALYAFAAKNPASPALVIHRIEANGEISAPVGTVPIPANYGIHDTFVRDGLAFVSAWNTGLIIYDVGDGRAGGSVSTPVEVGRIVTASNGVPGGAAVHNAWWFHNPVRQEQRYVFVGQEGPGTVGSSASGDLHVVDVSNMAAPVEVASLRIPGAGAHNFWMDEAREVLYVAFYNGGVVMLDVSGTLAGDLSDRIMATLRPGGGAYTWGVMLHQGSLYASDMVSGLWQLDPP